MAGRQAARRADARTGDRFPIGKREVELASDRGGPGVPDAFEAAVGEAERASGIPAAVWRRYLRPAAAGKGASERPRPSVRRAVLRLARTQPEMSAAYGAWAWQAVAIAVPVGMMAGASMLLPAAVAFVAMAVVSLPFLLIVLWRLAALVEAALPDERPLRRSATPLTDAQLPPYTVLVALYKEAQVLPGLVDALDALDYPRDRLQILLVLEEADEETRLAAARIPLPAHVGVVVVPDRQPRTKPKALNYALQIATGEIVAVYDAEDEPEPDQLRKAAAVLVAGRGRIGCAQARLTIDPQQPSWIARQFALEYAALFNGLLPVLAAWRLPVPLGGTSNHFLRSALEEVGGWDPYNVTEDADLGIRLGRAGFRVAMVASQTFEEAPQEFDIWLKQRTRWLKGYMQTLVVHTRQPRRLVAELGMWGTLGFLCTVAGVALSALVHPFLYVMVVVAIVSGTLPEVGDSIPSMALATVAWTNLAVGYGAAIALAAIATRRGGWRAPAVSLLTLPVYWLLVSIAGYRALWQLTRTPHSWEKTPHRARPGRRAAPGSVNDRSAAAASRR